MQLLLAKTTVAQTAFHVLIIMPLRKQYSLTHSIYEMFHPSIHDPSIVYYTPQQAAINKAHNYILILTAIGC